MQHPKSKIIALFQQYGGILKNVRKTGKMYARHFGIVFYIMGTVLVLYSMSIEFFDLANDYFIYVMLVVILLGVGYLNMMGRIIKKQSHS